MQLPEKKHIASFDIDAQNTFTPVCPDELPVAEGDTIAPELNAQAPACASLPATRTAVVRSGSATPSMLRSLPSAVIPILISVGRHMLLSAPKALTSSTVLMKLPMIIRYSRALKQISIPTVPATMT